MYVLKVEKSDSQAHINHGLWISPSVGSQPFSPVNLPSFALLVKTPQNDIRRHTGRIEEITGG